MGGDPQWTPERLRPDCERCAGLCCVASVFTRSADFPVSKAFGEPCRNLDAGSRCRVHPELRQRGFNGCVAFDCFGAGQQVVAMTFAGRSWRDDPELATRQFAAYQKMLQLHELLWFLAEALRLDPQGPQAAALADAQREVRGLTGLDPAALLTLTLRETRGEINALLLSLSARLRARSGGLGPDHHRGDLLGARLRGRDLRRATLFAALLLGADLSGADLRGADLRVADLRGADLSGADLRGCLFVTQTQLEGARGDRRTRLPEVLTRPDSWLV